MPEFMPCESDDAIMEKEAYAEGLASIIGNKNPYPRNFPLCRKSWDEGHKNMLIYLDNFATPEDVHHMAEAMRRD